MGSGCVAQVCARGRPSAGSRPPSPHAHARRSLAQVYRAKLVDRDDGVLDVAVKVIHPKVQVATKLRGGTAPQPSARGLALPFACGLYINFLSPPRSAAWWTT